MRRFRLPPYLLLAAGGALAIIVTLTLAGLWTADLLGYAARTGGNDAAILSAAAAVARHSGATAATAAEPTRMGMTPESLDERSAASTAAASALAEHLDALENAAAGAGYDARLAAIRAHSDALLDDARRIDAGRPELLRLLHEGRENYRRFSYDYRESLNSALVTSLDDQIYDMMTWEVGPGVSPDPAENPVSRHAVFRYQHTFELLASARVAIAKLVEASALSHPFQVVIVREEYEAAAQRMRSSLDDHYQTLGDAPDAQSEIHRLSNQGLADASGAGGHIDAQSEIHRLSNAILDAGAGENNLFQTLDRRLQLAAAEQRRIDSQRQTLTALHREVDALVAEVTRRAAAKADINARNAVLLRIILLVVGIAGAAGALAASYYRARRPV